MPTHATEKIPLAPGAKVFENTKAIALSESQWFSIKQIRSQGVFADAVKGNVIEHVARGQHGG
jgi:hypothetical protein